jgi:hypothetical protein
MIGARATGRGRRVNSGKKRKAIIQIKTMKPKSPRNRMICSGDNFLGCFGV